MNVDIKALPFPVTHTDNPPSYFDSIRPKRSRWTARFQAYLLISLVLSSMALCFLSVNRLEAIKMRVRQQLMQDRVAIHNARAETVRTARLWNGAVQTVVRQASEEIDSLKHQLEKEKLEREKAEKSALYYSAITQERAKAENDKVNAAYLSGVMGGAALAAQQQPSPMKATAVPAISSQAVASNKQGTIIVSAPGHSALGLSADVAAAEIAVQAVETAAETNKAAESSKPDGKKAGNGNGSKFAEVVVDTLSALEKATNAIKHIKEQPAAITAQHLVDAVVDLENAAVALAEDAAALTSGKNVLDMLEAKLPVETKVAKPTN
ncbi:hypothetical protein HK102_014012 [Quaeritorhiza haematococci]|nr:hypothetical protein HK102_014012 [Quaeritorhiza haematococci]